VYILIALPAVCTTERPAWLRQQV